MDLRMDISAGYLVNTIVFVIIDVCIYIYIYTKIYPEKKCILITDSNPPNLPSSVFSRWIALSLYIPNSAALDAPGLPFWSSWEAGIFFPSVTNFRIDRPGGVMEPRIPDADGSPRAIEVASLRQRGGTTARMVVVHCYGCLHVPGVWDLQRWVWRNQLIRWGSTVWVCRQSRGCGCRAIVVKNSMAKRPVVLR